MTEMERSALDKRLAQIRSRFSDHFEEVAREGERVIFKRDGNVYFSPSLIDSFHALVIEYTDSERKAISGVLGEDGDLFYLDEMDEDEMFAAMLQEVTEAY